MANDEHTDCTADLNTGTFCPNPYKTEPGASFTVKALLDGDYPDLMYRPAWLEFESKSQPNEGDTQVVIYTFTVRRLFQTAQGNLLFGPKHGKRQDKMTSGTIDVSASNEG